MSNLDHGDTVPGEESLDIESLQGARGYTIDLAALLTAASFWIASTDPVWGPAVPVGIIVLAIIGSVWVMTHLNHTMHMAPHDMMQQMR